MRATLRPAGPGTARASNSWEIFTFNRSDRLCFSMDLKFPMILIASAVMQLVSTADWRYKGMTDSFFAAFMNWTRFSCNGQRFGGSSFLRFHVQFINSSSATSRRRVVTAMQPSFRRCWYTSASSRMLSSYPVTANSGKRCDLRWSNLLLMTLYLALHSLVNAFSGLAILVFFGGGPDEPSSEFSGGGCADEEEAADAGGATSTTGATSARGATSTTGAISTTGATSTRGATTTDVSEASVSGPHGLATSGTSMPQSDMTITCDGWGSAIGTGASETTGVSGGLNFSGGTARSTSSNKFFFSHAAPLSVSFLSRNTSLEILSLGAIIFSPAHTAITFCRKPPRR